MVLQYSFKFKINILYLKHLLTNSYIISSLDVITTISIKNGQPLLYSKEKYLFIV